MKATNTEDLKTEYIFYRVGGNNSQIYYPTSVVINAYNYSNFTLTKVMKDGVPTYVLEKGEVHEEYNKSNLFNYDSYIQLKATYDIENPQEEGSTTTYADRQFTSTGYKVTQDSSGISAEQTVITAGDSHSGSLTLYRYTPGSASWGNSYIDYRTSLRKSDLEEFYENGTIDLSFSSYFGYTMGTTTSGGACTINQGNGSLQYYNKSNNSYSTIGLSENEIRVKEIRVSSFNAEDSENAWIKFYKPGATEPFFTATQDNLVYTPAEGEVINSYKAVVNRPLIYKYDGWITDFELSASALQAKGLTQEQILNIRKITKTQGSDGGSNIYIGNGEASVTVYGFDTNAWSHFVLRGTSLDATASEKGVPVEGVISLSSTSYGLTQNDLKDIYVQNTNPKFYVVLPKYFDFEIDKVYMNVNYMYVKNYKIKKIGDNKVLIIEVEGTDTKSEYYERSSYYKYASCIINYTRTLKDNVFYDVDANLQAYMETDEGIYYGSGVANDSQDFNGNGDYTEKMAYHTLNYKITQNAQIQVRSAVYSAYGDLKTNEDVYLQSGKTVKYQVALENRYEPIRKVNIISKLPFESNTSILGLEKINYGSNVTFENVRNINVYMIYANGSRGLIADSRYTVGYSAQADADFDTEFSTNAEDASTAKMIQVKFNDNYTVSKGSIIAIEYEMDIPEGVEAGKFASQSSAVRYVNSSSSEMSQESSRTKVIVGSPTGKIEVIKTFTGSNNTHSVSGINIKLTNMSDETEYYEKVTDENGHVIFTDVPLGDWEISETTEIEGYKAGNKYVSITNGEEYTEANGNAISIVNEPLIGKLEITKEYEDKDKDIYAPSFRVEGVTIAGEEYSDTFDTEKTIDEDESESISGFIYLPYGTYTIKEGKYIQYSNVPEPRLENRPYGWFSEDKEVNINQPIVSVNIINKISKGIVEIHKTVPEGDNPEGLKFRLYGTGDLRYVNTAGDTVTFNVDKETTIGENGIGIIEDVPVGTYTLEEIEMPTIDTDSGAVTRYIPRSRTVTIKENQEVKVVSVTNKWKTGTLKIDVTATEGTELNVFRVKVSGTSYYGTEINQEYDVPESGKLTINDLPIGKYKVEELNTKLVNGKIITTDPDGYEVTYNPENVNEEGIIIEYNRTSNVTINNEYAGTGIVKITKSLEGETDPSKAKNIQFRIKGKDYVGRDVDELITIGEDGTGTSNPIPVGTYLLSEVEDSVSEDYVIADEQEITITTANTEENPQVISIENPLATGNIVMETETKTGGIPPTPVTYTVTKVDDDLQALEDGVDVTGNARSHAELTNLKAGKYLVEQKNVPEGYLKDNPQVVTISRNESGYSLFVIEKPAVEEFEKTRVTINKEIVNNEGNTATEEDFTNAKLNSNGNYSFEVRIQNTVTNQTYYAFVGKGSSKTILGLPYGTYEVEEVYKPKFKFVEMTGTRLNYSSQTKKYTFTLSEEKTEEENSIVINVKNQIDPEFGFGGQDPEDNLSKVSVEEVETAFVTQSKIYVRDDENNKVSDVTFKLYDKNNNAVKLSGSNGVYIPSEDGLEEFSPVNGAIALKSLPVGEYTLKCISVNEAYLKANDYKVKVYENAVGVRKIELLRNIPRGTLRLSTVYTDDYGTERYVRSSKYKIINTAGPTGEILTFVKKADGTYERSNLAEATEEITLKAGYVDVTGIEVLDEGEVYQVGLVNAPNEYGIISDTMGTTEENAIHPVTIKENQTEEVKVEVKDRTKNFVKVVASNYGIMALDTEGKIWLYDTNLSSSSVPSGALSFGYSVDDGYRLKSFDESQMFSYYLKDVKFKDIYLATNNANVVMAIDEDGKLWTWGYKNENSRLLGGYDTYNRTTPQCISNTAFWRPDSNSSPQAIENNPKIKQIAINDYSSSSTYAMALDENGKVWYWGANNYGQDPSNKWLPDSTIPICISDLLGLEDKIITYVACRDSRSYVIDNEGNVYVWGSNGGNNLGLPEGAVSDSYTKPICINKIEGSSIANVKIKKVELGDGMGLFLDTENRVWSFGFNYSGAYTLGNCTEESISYYNPVCLNENVNNPLHEVGVTDIFVSYQTAYAIDEYGKVWAWGSDRNALLGYGDEYSSLNGKYGSSVPTCINTMENNKLTSEKIVSLASSISNLFTVAIDDSGDIWYWGNKIYAPLGTNISGYTEPIKLPLAKNAYVDILKFDKVDIGEYSSSAIDDKGRIWSWGKNNYLGIGYVRNDGNTNTPVLTGRFNEEFMRAKFIDVSIGESYTLALDSEGRLWGWGYVNNTYLGLNYCNLGYSQYTPICITEINADGNILYGKKIIKIETGHQISVVIDSDGKLYTMGYNNRGQLGINESSSGSYNVKCVNEVNSYLQNAKFKDVSCGCDYVLALSTEGILFTWGYNSDGQLGLGNTNTQFYPTAIANKITSISAGYNHSLAIDEDGNVFAWGDNYYNQLGFNSSGTDILNRFNVSTYTSSQLYGKKIVRAVAGDCCSLFEDEDGKIYTIGYNYNGQTGQSTYQSGMLVCINDDIALTLNDVGIYPVKTAWLVTDKNGAIWSWGKSDNGLIGFTSQVNTPRRLQGATEKINPYYGMELDKISDMDGETVSSNMYAANAGNINDPNALPVDRSEVVYGGGYQAVYADKGATNLILDKSGNLWMKGNNTYGQIGDGTTDYVEEYKVINEGFGGKKISKVIYCGQQYIAVQDEDGYLWTWGSNSNGIIGGISPTEQSIVSTPHNTGLIVKDIKAYYNEIIVLDSNDDIYVWGNNSYGQCGNGSTSNYSIDITKISALEGNVKEILSVGTNGNYVIVLDKNNKIWTWGQNSYGARGNGTTSNVTSPYQIPDITVDKIISTGDVNIVQDAEGKIWTWGQNTYGQCGVGNTNIVTTPTCINEASGFVVDMVICAGSTIIVQDTEGKIWSWGQNTYGQCGTGTTTNVTSPTQINSTNGLKVSKVYSYNNTTNIVQDTDGKLWTWGQNNNGQCGTGTNSNVMEPTCILEENINIEKIVSTYGGRIIVQDTEGKWWTWGYNGDGQCGTNSEDTYCTPACINDIEGLENIRFKFYSEGPGWITVKDEDNKLWIWGSNADGRLGVGVTDTVIRVPFCRTDYFNQIGLTKEITNSSSSCILDDNGDIWSWGVNTYGQRGTGNTDTVYEVTCITSEFEVKFDRILASGNSFIAVDTEGKIWTWGQNNNGQCGTGTTENVLSPTCIGEDVGLVYNSDSQYNQSYNFSRILNANGDMFVWGNGITSVTKVNNLEPIKGAKIKETAINSSNYSNIRIDVLTNEGRLFRINKNLEVEDISGPESYGYSEAGPWPFEFKTIYNMNYRD